MKHETLRASQLNGCAFCVDMHVKGSRPSADGRIARIRSKPRDGRV